MSQWMECNNRSTRSGEQTILIRKYATTLNEFLLYPTVSYANKDDYLDSFDKKHRKFVKKNTLPEKQDEKS